MATLARKANLGDDLYRVKTPIPWLKWFTFVPRSIWRRQVPTRTRLDLAVTDSNERSINNSKIKLCSPKIYLLIITCCRLGSHPVHVVTVL